MSSRSKWTSQVFRCMLPIIFGCTSGGCSVKDSYPWYASFVNAILEFDRARVSQRVELAHRAIDERIEDLENKGELLSAEEHEAIGDALSELRVHERETAGRPRAAS